MNEYEKEKENVGGERTFRYVYGEGMLRILTTNAIQATRGKGANVFYKFARVR